MKKAILILLFAGLNVLLLEGCADDGNDNDTNVELRPALSRHPARDITFTESTASQSVGHMPSEP